MINSMTAFARTEKTVFPLTVRMEIRSYNSKNLDMVIRLPQAYQCLEEKFKGLVAREIFRGRIEINCQILKETDEPEAFEINMPKAMGYHRALLELKDRLSLSGEITLDQLTAAGPLIRPAEVVIDPDAHWPVIADCLNESVKSLAAMRATEGANMALDLSARLNSVESLLNRIEAGTSGLIEHYRSRLMDRIQALTKGVVELDGARVAQEAAILADRSDISEEITRAHSHIQQFRTIMAADEPAGRKLNFLLQEFNREFNTMGSKAGNAGLSHTIVEVKSELEKMREQVQNVE